jgi:hypothetical protein
MTMRVICAPDSVYSISIRATNLCMSSSVRTLYNGSRPFYHIKVNAQHGQQKWRQKYITKHDHAVHDSVGARMTLQTHFDRIFGGRTCSSSPSGKEGTIFFNDEDALCGRGGYLRDTRTTNSKAGWMISQLSLQPLSRKFDRARVAS